MGVINRQRRRAKQARRRQQYVSAGYGRARPPFRDGPTERVGEPPVDAVVMAAAGLDGGWREDTQTLLAWLSEDPEGSGRAHRVAATLTRLLTDCAAAGLRGGWEPRDLGQLLRRRVGAVAIEISLPAIATAAGRAVFKVQRNAWSEQLAALSADPRPFDPRSSRWPAEVAVAVASLRVLARLHALPDLNSMGRTSPSRRSGVNERMFSKVRALLSKAESSEFAEESDALMAKAQELITRHSLDRAMLEAGDEATRSTVSALRCWLDDPYVPAKGLLLATVAQANRCRAVASTELGFVTLIGRRDDIDVSEVLFTSLLVQATRRMMADAGGPRGNAGARRPSYRRSFLVAYASRIGGRLEAADSAAVQAATAEMGELLLPVLASRRNEVDGTVRELFPNMVNQRFSVTDLAGWAAGTAAADLADLGSNPMLAGRTA